MKKNLAVLFASAALLAACGGGGDDVASAPAPTSPAPAPAAASIPSSVGDSVANLIGYLAALLTISDNTIEPLNLTPLATTPTSETAEPTPLP